MSSYSIPISGNAQFKGLITLSYILKILYDEREKQVVI